MGLGPQPQAWPKILLILHVNFLAQSEVTLGCWPKFLLPAGPDREEKAGAPRHLTLTPEVSVQRRAPAPQPDLATCIPVQPFLSLSGWLLQCCLTLATAIRPSCHRQPATRQEGLQQPVTTRSSALAARGCPQLRAPWSEARWAAAQPASRQLACLCAVWPLLVCKTAE